MRTKKIRGQSAAASAAPRGAPQPTAREVVTPAAPLSAWDEVLFMRAWLVQEGHRWSPHTEDPGNTELVERELTGLRKALVDIAATRAMTGDELADYFSSAAKK